MSRIKVLYEDNHIIAVVKPAGVLTQGDKSGDVSLFDIVKDYLKEKKNKKTPSNPSGQAGNVFLGLVHRLDKPVQGIVLFGKTSKGASRLSEQFRNHKIQKTYHAIVVGRPKEEKGSIKEQVNKISFFAEGFTNKTDEELLAEIKKATKTRTAELSWEVVKTNGKYSLLKILPKTGRFHQIRIQLENMGHPILGDTKYSGEKSGHRVSANLDWHSRDSIALAATAISFKTATTNETKKLEIPLPKEWDGLI
jgi:23S rRNA pseudouridine1911/1915/1917 synthase